VNRCSAYSEGLAADEEPHQALFVDMAADDTPECPSSMSHRGRMGKDGEELDVASHLM
jgi:hypothetical protein